MSKMSVVLEAAELYYKLMFFTGDVNLCPQPTLFSLVVLINEQSDPQD